MSGKERRSLAAHLGMVPGSWALGKNTPTAAQRMPRLAVGLARASLGYETHLWLNG